jgi:gluconolactonase
MVSYSCSRTLFITESDTGSILKAEFDPSLGISGAPLFSGVSFPQG